MSGAGAANGWWQASDGNWYPPQASEGWWQASDGQWYPPHASEGWWQASDGQWYPPSARPATPTPAPAPAPVPASAPERSARTPQGPVAPADDVAPAEGPEGGLLLTRARCLHRLERADGATEPLERMRDAYGADEGATSTLQPPAEDPIEVLAWALDELAAGDDDVSRLVEQRAARAFELEQAEAEARAARTKLIAAGVATVVVLVLVLVLFVL